MSEGISMATNVVEVLKKSKAIQKRLEFATYRAAWEGGQVMQRAIREQIPHGAFQRRVGNFKGYAASGRLWKDVRCDRPRQKRSVLGRYKAGFEVDVYMDRSGRSAVYQRIHEVGGEIRPRNKPYLVFRVPPYVGKWVRTTLVRIKRKRYFATGWRNGAKRVPAQFAVYFLREARLR